MFFEEPSSLGVLIYLGLVYCNHDNMLFSRDNQNQNEFRRKQKKKEAKDRKAGLTREICKSQARAKTKGLFTKEETKSYFIKGRRSDECTEMYACTLVEC